MNEDNCFICEKGLFLEATSIVKERGIASLIESSKAKKDKNHCHLKGLLSITVHERCRKIYLKTRKAESEERRCSMRGAQTFDYKNKCIICTQDASSDFMGKENKKNAKRRETVHHVMTLQFQDSLVAAATRRGDKEVLQRVSSVLSLVIAQARYHKTCGKNFLGRVGKRKEVGRSEDEHVTEAFDFICKYLEDNDDECQFTLPEILKDFKGHVPTYKALYARLFKKYGDDIIVANVGGKTSVICFRATGEKILNANFYKPQNLDSNEERLRIVKAAAGLCREDIRSMTYDTNSYPKVENFLGGAEKDIPETLNVLLTEIIASPKQKKETQPQFKTKVIALAHAIISAARPRSFISPILTGLGAVLYKKYGSKDLVEMLSSLGFCCSYNDAKLFEASCIRQPPQILLDGSFSQFVWDNADANINTIDGNRTFHAMGGLHCITPQSSVRSEKKITKLKNVPLMQEMSKLNEIPLVTYHHHTTQPGLKSIPIYDINQTNPLNDVQISPKDFLWIYGKWKQRLDIPGWNGFMEKLTAGQPFHQSCTLCLPFLNNPPGNTDTIYSVLLESVQRKGKNQKCCFVTFDQPLYQKARQIVASCNPTSPVASVIVRLGGFHLLMSFMGAIGYIMDGSGLQDLLSTIYARASTDKLLSGHAYSRAVRGHTLIHLALANIVLSKMDIPDQDNDVILDTLNNVGLPLLSEKLQQPPIKSTLNNFHAQLLELEQHGATAKLWVQYFRMVTILKKFIQAERSGDWKLHLECVQQMLPYFHASGHFLYAKSSQLYLQDMINLESRLTADEFKSFVKEGCFTVRRTSKFWSGVWTDMTIEQVVMRTMKTRGGGLTHGRGISDSTLMKWIASMPPIMEITMQFEDFCGFTYASSEQHIDARVTRVARDNKDVKVLLEWLISHDPFPTGKMLMSISTGVVGDATINCHEARERGNQSIQKIVGQNFNDVKFQRKHRVVPLKALQSKVKIHNEDIPVNTETIFRRIIFLKQSNSQLQDYFAYELAPYPTSIFDDVGMRKTKKSVFYELFNPVAEALDLSQSAFVIDGGYLLHKVHWMSKEIFSNILIKYVDFMKCHYRPEVTTVVFDGYGFKAKSTKTAERVRRQNKGPAATVFFTEAMTSTMPKETFLSSEKNKERLIGMLSTKLTSEGFTVIQAVEDADTLIVRSAIEKANEFLKVVIVGEDTDLLILLTSLAPNSKIFLMKPGKGNTTNELFSPRHLKCSNKIKEHLLFLHAMSGCDTTSAFFRQGKMKFVKTLENDTSLQEAAKCFQDPDASQDVLAEAGERFLAAVYSPKDKETSLDHLRYNIFTRTMVKTAFNLAALPPTTSAARQHSLRVFHQVQSWYGRNLDPLNWGWKCTAQGLFPVTTTKEPAPNEVLSSIACKCVMGCSGRCTCRKAGLQCSTICINCKGQACSNSPVDDELTTSSLNVDEEPDMLLEKKEDDSLPLEEEVVEVGAVKVEQVPSTSKRLRI